PHRPTATPTRPRRPHRTPARAGRGGRTDRAGVPGAEERARGGGMSDLARANGWRGFDNIAERVDGGWRYRCDGMPTLRGCGAEVTVTRRLTRVGLKSTGW